MPEKTEAQKRAQKKYMEKFMVARVRMERSRYEQVQAAATAQGESVNGFINAAIDTQMGKPSTSPVEAPIAHDGDGVVSLPPETLNTAQKAAQNAGETVPQFIERAVDTQAKRDEVARKMEGVTK